MAEGFLVVDRDGVPSWDSHVHDTRDAAEAVAVAANAYFFNVEQPAYVVEEASPAVVYFADEQARSQTWLRRHLDTIERLRVGARSDIHHLIQPVIGHLRMFTEGDWEMPNREHMEGWIKRLRVALAVVDALGDDDARAATDEPRCVCCGFPVETARPPYCQRCHDLGCP